MTGSLSSSVEKESDLHQIRCLFSYEGSWAISLSDTQPVLWNAETGADIASLSGHRSWVNAVAFSPDGKKIITMTEDSELNVWDTANGKKIISMSDQQKSFSSCAFSPDGMRIICGLSDGTLVILDSDTLQIVNTIQVSAQAILTCAFSPDGQVIVAGSEDGVLQLRAADSGSLMFSLNNQIDLVFTINGHTAGISTCAFSFDGKKIISGSKDTTVKIWDTTTGAFERTLQGHSGPITCLSFSVDRNKIVTGSEDTTVRIWNTSSGVSETTIHCCSGAINACAFYPDGKTICTGLSDNTIKTWDIGTGKNRIIFERIIDKKNRDAEKEKITELFVAYKQFQADKNDKNASRIIYLSDSFDKIILTPNNLSIMPLQILCMTYYEMKDFSTAMKKYQELLERQQLILGKDNPEIVTTLCNIATTHIAMNQISLAEESIKSAIIIQQSIPLELSDVHNSEISKLSNIIHNIRKKDNLSKFVLLNKEIETLLKNGEYDTAIKRSQEACDYARMNFGESSEEYCIMLINLADLYRLKPETVQRAESLLSEALFIQEKILGRYHPRVGELQFHLGTLTLALGKRDKARGFINEAIASRMATKEGWNEEIGIELDKLINIPDKVNRIKMVKETKESAGLSEDRQY